MRTKFGKEEYDFWVTGSINITAIEAGLQEPRWYSYLMFSFISRIFEEGNFFSFFFPYEPCRTKFYIDFFFPLVNNSCLLLLLIWVVGHVGVCSAPFFVLFHMLPRVYLAFMATSSLSLWQQGFLGHRLSQFPSCSTGRLWGMPSSSCGRRKNTQTAHCSSSSHHMAAFSFQPPTTGIAQCQQLFP